MRDSSLRVKSIHCPPGSPSPSMQNRSEREHSVVRPMGRTPSLAHALSEKSISTIPPADHASSLWYISPCFGAPEIEKPSPGHMPRLISTSVRYPRDHWSAGAPRLRLHKPHAAPGSSTGSRHLNTSPHHVIDSDLVAQHENTQHPPDLNMHATSMERALARHFTTRNGFRSLFLHG
ncbi:hypothetical protein OH77DRAFT_1424399 [Trametes cingulata]|nr:hypothetical protein OH77DRAFT_1424399 [Trametes cingulata]